MIRVKKSLGQHWLRSKTILAEMVKAGEAKAGDVILEVGPGQGSLTEALLATGARVIAVEKDDRLIDSLQAKFASEISHSQLVLIRQDILEFNFLTNELKAGGYKIVANLPYYLTGQFLRRVLTSTRPPSLMVLLLQKEVAERIVAKNKKESLLSISVKTAGTPKYIKTVPKKYFLPPPKVDSAILKVNNISKNFFTDISQTKFFALVKKGFAQKRKMLKGNLNCPLAVLNKCGIAEKARAEELSLGEWKCLMQNDKK